MNLYEALKAGTSKEELLKAFHKELDEATARIEEEKQAAAAAEQEELEEYRELLAEAIVEYLKALFEEDNIPV